MLRNRTLVISAAGAILGHVSSWFLPVNGSDYPGWRAFRIALAPAWPYLGVTADTFFGTLISVASALTNVWFLFALAALAFSVEGLLSHALLGPCYYPSSCPSQLCQT